MGNLIMLHTDTIKREKRKKTMYESIVSELEKKHTENGTSLYTSEFIDDVVDRILENSTDYTGDGLTPIISIINEFGFKVYREQLSFELPGDILVEKEAQDSYGIDKVILVHKEDSLEQQRFVAAHELGHYLFDILGNKKNTENKHYNKDNHESEHERRANKFAAAILMPRKLFISQYNYAKSLNPNRTFILKYLSKYFQTTISSIEKRIKEVLGECVGYESEISYKAK